MKPDQSTKKTDQTGIAEFAGQAVVEEIVDAKDASGKPITPKQDVPNTEPPLDKPKEVKPEEKDSKPGGDKVVGGFKTEDLLKAPVKVPELAKKDSKKATSNPIVKTLVLIGVVLVVLGLIFAFTVSTPLGIVLMFLGSVAIIACVFLPIGAKKK